MLIQQPAYGRVFSGAPFGLGEFCRPPCLPTPEQRAAWFADRLVQEFGSLHPVSAEVAKALPHLAPRDQDALRVGVAEHDGPDDALGPLAVLGAV